MQLLNIDCDEQKVSYQVDMEDEEIYNIRKQMNFSITGPSDTAPLVVAPSKEPKDEKKEYLAQILNLEEKLK